MDRANFAVRGPSSLNSIGPKVLFKTMLTYEARGRRQPIAIGNLGNSDDLKCKFPVSINFYSTSSKYSLCFVTK